MREYFFMVSLYLVELSTGFKTRHGAVSNETIQVDNASLEITPNTKFLDSAPCPPPWDVSFLFSDTVCLDCDQKIVVLQRCLEEWDLKLDCEQILSCTDCNSCGLCRNTTNDDSILVTLPKSTTETDKSDDAYYEDIKSSLAVSLTLSLGIALFVSCILAIVFVIVRRKKRQNLNASRRTKTQIDDEEKKYDTLLKLKCGMDDGSGKHRVFDKLLFPEQETCSPEQTKGLQPP